MVQYLHFWILKFPWTIVGFRLRLIEGNFQILFKIVWDHFQIGMFSFDIQNGFWSFPNDNPHVWSLNWNVSFSNILLFFWTAGCPYWYLLSSHRIMVKSWISWIGNNLLSTFQSLAYSIVSIRKVNQCFPISELESESSHWKNDQNLELWFSHW